MTSLCSCLNWGLPRVFFLGCELAECVCGMYTEAGLFKGFSLPLDSMTLEREETTSSCWRVFTVKGSLKKQQSAVLFQPFL